MPTYQCLCCGHAETFESADAAFQSGWDVAPYFTLQPLCNLCPAAPVVLHGLDGARTRHASLHKKWRCDGRPKEIDIAAEFELDGATAQDSEKRKAEISALQKSL